MKDHFKFQYFIALIIQISFATMMVYFGTMMISRNAAAQTINIVGDHGDHQTVDKCQGSGFLVGFFVKSGDWLDQIGTICSPVTADGKTGAPTFGSGRGGNGGSPPHNVTCAVNEVAVGVLVHLTSDNRRVRGIGLDCKNVLDVGRQGLGTIVGLGHTDSAAISQLCNPGNAIVEAQIDWGKDVNGFGLVCGPVPKIGSTSTPPPPNTGSSTATTGTGVTGWAIPTATSVTSPATINQMVPGQVLAKDGCTANAKVPPAQGDNASTISEGVIICLINAERTARNLRPLTVDNNLQAETVKEGIAAATIKWWHDGASPHNNPQTGSTPDSRIRSSGYCGGSTKVSSDGEIAWNGAGTGNYYDDNGKATSATCLSGCGSPLAAVDWWMNISPPHRALILTPGYTHIGVAAVGDMADPKYSSAPAKGLYIVDFGSCQ